MVLCAVLLALNLWQLRRISDLEQAVRSAPGNLEVVVRNMDQRLASLRSELASANDLVRDWSYTTAVNREKRGLDVKVSVVLKEWQAGTAATLLWKNEYGNGGEGSVPLSGNGAGAFTGTLELPLSDFSGEYSLDTMIENGETQRRENLGGLGDISILLPVQCRGWSWSGPTYQKGVFTLSHCTADVYGLSEKVPEIEAPVFRLARNGEVMSERTATQRDWANDYECGEEWSVECQTGDEMTLTFSCRDRDGLGYEFFLGGWRITGKGGMEDFASDQDWPKLTWD